MQESDFKGLQFLAIPNPKFIEVSGRVIFENEEKSLIFKEEPKV